MGIYDSYLATQGAQQQLQIKASQLQKAQADLDDQKRQLQSAGAAFQGLQMPQQGPPPGGPAPQPPMPGQASQPMQRPGAPPMGGAPGAGMPPGGPQQGPSQQRMQSGPTMPPPQPQQPPMAPPQGQPPQQGGGQPGGMGAAQQPMQILAQMAQQLKQQNPGLDPATLMQALTQQVGLMKGVQPEIKDQMMAMIQQLRMETQSQISQQKLDSARDLTEMRIGATERGQDMRQTAGQSDMPEEEKNYWADVLRRGGSLPPGLSRTAGGSKLVQELMKRVPDGSTPQDYLSSQAEYGGQKAGERALGTRTASMGMAVNEANNMAKLVSDASAAVPRTGFVPANKALNAFASNTGDPKIVQFGAALNSFINAYARAISPSGTPTVSDKDHARDMLSTAQTKDQVDAVVSQLQKEMKAASQAPGQVRSEFRDGYGGAKDQAAPSGVIKYDAQGNRVQ